MLKDVKDFIQKINLSLLKDFFESSLPANYTKIFINTKDPDKNKEFVAEIKDRISNLKDRVKNNEWNRKKNADETLEIIKEIFNYNKNAQKSFQLASKVDKGKSEPKLEKSIAERVKSKNEKIAEIKKKEENINNLTFKSYFANYLSPSDVYKKLRYTKGKKKENQVYLIEEILNWLKETVKNMPKDEVPKVENEKIIDIVKRILYFNQLEQQGSGLKILTPNQMLSRLPITLAQLKAGNNSEKLKNEIRQLLYSLYRSKKLTKQLYKSLIDII